MEVIARSAGKSTEQMAQNEGNRWMSGLIPLCPEIENGRAADPLPEILAGHHGWTNSSVSARAFSVEGRWSLTRSNMDACTREGEPSGLIHRERNRQLGRDDLEDALAPEVSGRCPITRKGLDCGTCQYSV